MRIPAPWPAALLSALLWPGAPASAQETLASRMALAPDGYVKIWGGEGTVRVVGWDRDSVSVRGTRAPGPGRFFHQVDGRTAKLGFEAPEPVREEIQADLEIRIPRESGVWIRVAGAAVDVRGVEGAVDVLSVRGAVEIHGAPSTVDVESMAGSVALRLAGSEVVRIEGGAGSVTVGGTAADLSIRTVEGGIDVEDGAPRRVALESIDGRIRYRGGLAAGGALTIDTHTGDVELLLDPDASAAVDLLSVEGRIEADGRLRPASESPSGGSRRTGELGTGAGEIVARSYLGDITLTDPPDGS